MQKIGVAAGHDAASLNTFLQPGCVASVWRRQSPPDVQTWLDRLSPEVLPRGRVILPLNAVKTSMRHVCDMSGLIAGRE
ncbi:DUF1826 domain-containing protein [Ruegeria hyattellae]|uniref:DUF1826 domain-containing protein n=1 Tax=Ruegeria hyattellae TaxID=3233337 RepID=UPI00355BC894